jgi:hypothetical protein
MWQLPNKTNASSSIGFFLFIVLLTAKYHQYKHDTQQDANSEDIANKQPTKQIVLGASK